MIPKLKVENGELLIDGEFKFELSPTIYSEENLIPYKKITFDWCVEISQAEMLVYGEERIYEMFAEKLKQDFKKLLKNG